MASVPVLIKDCTPCNRRIKARFCCSVSAIYSPLVHVFNLIHTMIVRITPYYSPRITHYTGFAGDLKD